MTNSYPQPRPVISEVIRPKNVSDREKLQRVLSDLTRGDPGLRSEMGTADSETIISGMGELHLEIVCHRISGEFKIPIDIGKPEVIYLETIRKHAEAEGKYIRQLAGRGNYAHVKLRLEPGEPGSGYQFIDEITGGAVPAEFVEPVKLGVQQAMKGGVLGHEMVDLKAALYDGSYHVGDSNEMAFKIAGSMAFKEAAGNASPVVLEPLMSIEVVTPEDYAGGIMGDLSSRHGRIEEMESRDGSQVIRAIVPLAKMIGYAKRLRSSTQARAEYSMQFARYEESSGGDAGGDEAGVTANKPRSPKAGSGSAVTRWD